MAKQEVATKTESALPAHLQKGKTTRVGNIDTSDLIIPRVKLLQGVSEELTTFDGAKSGDFWHTVLGESLGQSIDIVPIIVRKGYTLWAPRNDDRGVLARARDAVHWDPPQGEFSVKLKGRKDPVIYKLAPTVAESGLDKFGSSNPDDSNSPPAAALTYEILAAFPNRPELGLAMIINTRSSVRPCKQFISKIEMRPVDHFGQVFTMSRVEDKGEEGPFWNYNYLANGYVQEEAQFERYAALYKQYSEQDYRASDEGEDAGLGGQKGSGGDADSSKF